MQERSFQAFLGNQRLQIPKSASDHPEEAKVRASWMPIDSLRCHLEKPLLPRRQPLPDNIECSAGFEPAFSAPPTQTLQS
jgi:hypothetical protein